MDIIPALKSQVVRRIDPAEKYAQVLSVVPNACVDVIAYRGNGAPEKREILLVERLEEPAKGFLWPPGGRIFKNEGLVACARRKLEQECGIKDATILRQIGAFAFSSEICSMNGVLNGFHAFGIDYLARVHKEDPAIKLDKTSNRYAWMGYDAINDKHPQGLHPYLFEVLNASNVFGQQFDKYDASHGQPEALG